MTVTVAELEFKPHPGDFEGGRAVVTFPNGFAASIVMGKDFYASPAQPYEIAVLDRSGISYNTPVTDDVLGHLTENAANQILREVEALPSKEEKT
jgi:hypothetical protein